MQHIFKYWDFVILLFAVANLVLGIRGFVLGHLPPYIPVMSVVCSAYMFYNIRHYFIKD